MTLTHGTARLESDRLVLRGSGRTICRSTLASTHARGSRSICIPKAWMEYTLASYEQHAPGYLAVVRKADAALIGRCGLTDMVAESARVGSLRVAAPHRRRASAPACIDHLGVAERLPVA
jgi:hypothetical protein